MDTNLGSKEEVIFNLVLSLNKGGSTEESVVAQALLQYRQLKDAKIIIEK